MKHARSTCLALLTLLFSGTLVFAKEAAPPSSGKNEGIASPSNETEAIEGTTWEGTDSDGDWYAYTFLKGGQLRYSTNTERAKIETFNKKEDVWAQNGTLVVMLITNYSVNVGTINGNLMTGSAWNVAGRRWTWTATKK